MNWSKRSNRWSYIIFIMVIVGAGMKFLFAFAYQDVGGQIAMAVAFLIGGIILLVVPAYFLGMLVDKFKKENAMVNKVSSDKIITKPVVEPKITNLHYGDIMPSDQINVSDNLISESKNLKPLITKDSDAFYAQAWDEINDQNKEPEKGLWAKSFADAQGNESLAKANYLKLRVEQLSKEYAQNITMEKERQIELLQQQDALTLEERKLERQAAQVKKKPMGKGKDYGLYLLSCIVAFYAFNKYFFSISEQATAMIGIIIIGILVSLILNELFG